MQGIVVPGRVIDASYRGEVQVILLNFGPDAFTVNPGDRITQLVIVPIYTGQPVRMYHIDSLGVTERGMTGFGSSGRAYTISGMRLSDDQGME